MSPLPKWVPITIGIAAVLLLAVSALGGYEYWTLRKELALTKADLGNDIRERDDALAVTKAENEKLANQLQAEQKKNGDFETQIGSINSTIGTLTKLSETDPQLLAKYSKIYFLNENYTPVKLSEIDSSYTYDTKRVYQFQLEALPFLTSLLADAKDAGINLEVISAYRSFGDQTVLKSSYKVTYGAGTANAFSADQGYSEHQLGTALDFTTMKVGATFAGFDKDPAYTWLTDNAYRYGFILSYPKKNTYYTYEPWHWRFVGVKLATTLHEQGKYFYDLDQRDINTYLISLFDPR